MIMNILTVDTATPQVTAGIVRVADDVADGTALETLAVESHLDSRAHNEVLTPLILSCLTTVGLKPADLDAVVVGCGPGPFTGLRVGMATAASFADALSIPCHGVCTLDAIAEDVIAADRTAAEEAQDPTDTLVVTDARRREVYFAAYRGGKRVFGSAVNNAVAVAESITAELPDFAPQRIVGSESHAQQVADAWSDAPSECAVIAQYPTPLGLAAAAGFADGTTPATPEPLVPLYLRRPDAVPPKQRPKSPAIPDLAATETDNGEL